jgi:hypothetical protein
VSALNVPLSVWRKSSYSENGSDCVEVAFTTDRVAARDSKEPDGPMLMFGHAQWSAFLARLNG